jgi:4-hydroxythreonine-4-phosphate dehydrogenase
MRIAVTLGDPAGIGPEIILKALGRLGRKSIPVIVGNRTVLDRAARHISPKPVVLLKPFGCGTLREPEIVDIGTGEGVIFGKSDASSGQASYRYILEALKLVFSGSASAVVTSPITKKSIQEAGIDFMGHTELMAHFSGSREYVMMMANRRLRVSLVTIHVPLKDVPLLVTDERVDRCIRVTAQSLHNDFGIEHPRIGVCGLNPHAGESGMMGTEETRIVTAIEKARAAGIAADGPLPADSLFHRVDYDAYIAMYHDQGLIPVKTMDFARTVNITLGLPIVRTSVGHGTGLDIAGQDLADPASLIEAYRIAEDMAATRSS